LWATAIFEGLDIAITPFGDLQFAPGTKRFFINKLLKPAMQWIPKFS